MFYTGGASGIGLGITRSFAEQGAQVSILDVNAEGAAIAKGLSAEFPNAGFSFHKVDVSNWDELAGAFQTIYSQQGRIDVVMANAGISKEASLLLDEETPTKPEFKTVDVNLVGTLYSKSLGLKLAPVCLRICQSGVLGHPLYPKERSSRWLQGVHHCHGVECWPLRLLCRTNLCRNQVRSGRAGKIVGTAAGKRKDPNQCIGTSSARSVAPLTLIAQC